MTKISGTDYWSHFTNEQPQVNKHSHMFFLKIEVQ